MFKDRGNSSSIISLHNNYFQYLIDVGLIGIIILYLILNKMFYKIEKLKLKRFKHLIIYILLIGVLEMGIIINNFLVFYFFIALVYYIDFTYYNLKKFSKYMISQGNIFKRAINYFIRKEKERRLTKKWNKSKNNFIKNNYEKLSSMKKQTQR